MASKEAKVRELDAQMEDSNFWLDNTHAQRIITERNEVRAWTVPYNDLKNRFKDVQDLMPESISAGDESLTNELLKELEAIEKGLSDLEVRRMLAGELDIKNCYLSINAGAGGTESCDWVNMLARMYERWAAKKKWGVEIISVLEGDVAGIKSITFKLTGDFAYGYSKAEKGVHRLVRISPFDSNAKRHTSFASVDVSPEISDDIVIDIRPDDVQTDTYRASGAGGQHVNKTDSAVRLTHIPSGIVVSCQNQRSQVQNKEACYKMLRSKLYENEVIARENALKALSGEKKEIAWGSQIRNYVFQPYTLVKDTRTKFETSNVQAVMDGDIDDFINAYLKEFG